MKVYRMRYTPMGAFGAWAFALPPVAAHFLFEADMEKIVSQMSFGRMHQLSTLPYTLLMLVSMLGLCMMLVGRETFDVDDEDR
ncbi:hypothetical protein QM996_00675 [Sinorhizobium chiapasense]